jgi:hypothetical protein
MKGERNPPETCPNRISVFGYLFARAGSRGIHDRRNHEKKKKEKERERKTYCTMVG